MKKEMVLIIIIIIMFIPNVNSNISQIGAEFIGTDNHLHTWNQNPRGLNESNIWFNASSGYIQFFNGEDKEEALERSSWLTSSFGLAYYSPNGNFNYLSKDTLNNATNEVLSNFNSYWEQRLYKCLNLTQGEDNREFCAGWIRGEETYSEYMDNDFYFYVNQSSMPPFTLLRNMSYLWEFKDINIENDNDADKINFCYKTVLAGDDGGDNENETYEFINLECDNIYTDDANSYNIHNLTSFEIIDPETKQGHFVLWDNQTDIRLRYGGNGSVMLESPFDEQLINFTGVKKTEMQWIDAGGVPCTSGIESYFAGGGTAIVCVDSTNQMTGYINKSGNLGPYNSYNNTFPIHGQRQIAPANKGEWVAYLGFNMNDSGMPVEVQNVSARLWNGLTVTQSDLEPDDWRTEFYDSNHTSDMIADNGGLEVGDWQEGEQLFIIGEETPPNGIDWSDPSYCDGSNRPCEIYIPFYNNSLDEGGNFSTGWNYSLQNGLWYHIMYYDASDFTRPQTWKSTIDIGGDPLDNTIRALLNFTFYVPDTGLNTLQNYPPTNIVYNTSSSININFSGNVSSVIDTRIEECHIRVNGTNYYDNTDVDIPPTYNFTINATFSNEGRYNWYIICNDKYGYTDTTSLRYFNISVTQIPSVSGEINIFPNIDKYPKVILNLSNHSLIILPEDKTLNKIEINKTLNISIFPNKLLFPYSKIGDKIEI